MATDKTAPARVARYTASMLSKGMVRVHVWVPTEHDAITIRRLADRMRRRATASSPRLDED